MHQWISLIILFKQLPVLKYEVVSCSFFFKIQFMVNPRFTSINPLNFPKTCQSDASAIYSVFGACSWCCFVLTIFLVLLFKINSEACVARASKVKNLHCSSFFSVAYCFFGNSSSQNSTSLLGCFLGRLDSVQVTCCIMRPGVIPSTGSYNQVAVEQKFLRITFFLRYLIVSKACS